MAESLGSKAQYEPSPPPMACQSPFRMPSLLRVALGPTQFVLSWSPPQMRKGVERSTFTR